MVKKYKKQVEMDWRGSNGSKRANPPMMEGFLLWNKGVNVWNGRRGRFLLHKNTLVPSYKNIQKSRDTYKSNNLNNN